VLLKITTGLVGFTSFGKPAESIQSGNYGNPPNAWWWLKQSIIYFCGLFGMKVCVLIIFLVLPWISRVGDWALKWTEGNEKLQIIFVMMLFPLIMNAMQYYIIDSFIKKQQLDHEPLAFEDSDTRPLRASSERYEERTLHDSDSEDDANTDNEGSAHRMHRSRQAKPDEYDPDFDGDAPTIVGSSSSRRNQQQERGKLLPTGLYPKE
jgi:hypothetical protein